MWVPFGGRPFAPAFAMLLGRRQPEVAQAEVGGYLGGRAWCRGVPTGVR